LILLQLSLTLELQLVTTISSRLLLRILSAFKWLPCEVREIDANDRKFWFLQSGTQTSEAVKKSSETVLAFSQVIRWFLFFAKMIDRVLYAGGV